MIKTKIHNIGLTEFFQNQIEELVSSEMKLIPARVIEIHREQYTIINENGVKTAKLKGSLFYNQVQTHEYPVIGDFVLVRENPLGDDLIYQVLERKSKFSRIDTHYSKEQVVATNFDYVFIMTSMNHDFNIKKMERYLTTAWNSGGQPIIILTKRDLCNDHNIYFNQLKGLAMGVPILSISSHTREGLDQLQPFFQPGKTIVFLGSSGVGKSSLLNTIAGIDLMKVNHIREDDSKGRHTTTHRQLVVLDNGSMIIDTPGMRELGMWDVTEGLNTTFSDIEEYAKNCKFSDCSHQTEGGCAIRTALDLGDLAISRWESYLKLEKEIKYAKSKENYKLRMKNKTNQKSLSKSRRNQEMVNFD